MVPLYILSLCPLKPGLYKHPYNYQYTAAKGHQELTSQKQLHSPAYIILFHQSLCSDHTEVQLCMLPLHFPWEHMLARELQHQKKVLRLQPSADIVQMKYTWCKRHALTENNSPLSVLSIQTPNLSRHLRHWSKYPARATGFTCFFSTRHHVREHLRLPKHTMKV